MVCYSGALGNVHSFTAPTLTSTAATDVLSQPPTTYTSNFQGVNGPTPRPTQQNARIDQPGVAAGGQPNTNPSLNGFNLYRLHRIPEDIPVPDRVLVAAEQAVFVPGTWVEVSGARRVSANGTLESPWAMALPSVTGPPREVFLDWRPVGNTGNGTQMQGASGPQAAPTAHFTQASQAPQAPQVGFSYQGVNGYRGAQTVQAAQAAPNQAPNYTTPVPFQPAMTAPSTSSTGLFVPSAHQQKSQNPHASSAGASTTQLPPMAPPATGPAVRPQVPVSTSSSTTVPPQNGSIPYTTSRTTDHALRGDFPGMAYHDFVPPGNPFFQP